MLFQFLRERFTKLFVIAKPAFELLDERLNVAASEDVKVFTAPLIHLAKTHGRFETAVLCAVVENIACLALLQNYGTCGAVERTLPVLRARAQEIFFTTSVFILDYLIALFLKASKHIEHTSTMKVALKIKKPVLTFIFILPCVLRLLFGEDYLLSTIEFLKALPGYVLNFAKAEIQRRMYVPCMKRVREMQKICPIFAFSCRRLVELAVLTILGISILFAFFSVYALDQNSCVPIIDEEYSQAFIVDTEGYDTENDDIDPDITLNDPGIETSRVLKITYIEDHLASDYEVLNCDDSVDKYDTIREDCEWKEVEVGKNVGKEDEEKEKENEEILSEEKEQIKEEEERVGVKVHVENDGASINESGSFLAFPSMDSVTCFSEEESIRIASDISIAMSEDLFDMRDAAAHVEEEVADGKEAKASVIHTKEEELKISQVYFESHTQAHSKASSLDNSLDMKYTRDHSYGFTPNVAPFMPRFAKFHQVPGFEGVPRPHTFPPILSNKVPAYWAPAPTVPIVVNAPRRPAKVGTRKSRHISLMGIPLKDRPQAVAAKP